VLRLILSGKVCVEFSTETPVKQQRSASTHRPTGHKTTQDFGVPWPPWWTWICPLAAWAILVIGALAGQRGLIAAAAGIVLISTVFAAVYHAEVVAHRTGEPFGTLVLAVAVTVIEVALIVSVMIAAPAEKAALARDTVFAAVMIVCNGIVGICLFFGGARHHEQEFKIQGASAALAVLAALTICTLILPNVATTVSGPRFSTSQLIFAGIVSLVLYGSFVFVQTIRHRDYFLPVDGSEQRSCTTAAEQNRNSQCDAAVRLAYRCIAGPCSVQIECIRFRAAQDEAETKG
jgi:Ca2+:H+ antiporter